MIRIDLGRGDGGRSSGKQSGIKGLNFGKLGRLGKLGGGRFKKVTGDIKGLFIVAISLAIACLPHLFFTQFRTFMIEQHEASKKRLEESVAVLTAEVAKLTPFKRELESYELQKKLVRDRLDVVRSLLSNRGTPVNVLDAVGQSLPRRTWVTDLDFNSSLTSQKLILTGQSYSNEDISDFLDKLSESVYFSDVKLEEMNPGKADGNVDVRTFRINAKPKVRVSAGAKPGEIGATNKAPAQEQ